MFEKTSETPMPSSRSMVSIASASSNEGTLSHSCCSSTIARGERMSGRIDSAWPSLMKNGPSETMTERSLATCAASASPPASSSPRSLSNATPHAHEPAVLMTCAMRVATAAGRRVK